jgi:hypothetical protein
LYNIYYGKNLKVENSEAIYIRTYQFSKRIMPSTSSSTSPKQRRFMHTVYAMQHGKMPKSGKAGEAANSMDPGDVKDFLMQEFGMKKCPMEVKQRIYGNLKELQEPTSLQEFYDDTTPDVIATAKTFNGDYKDTLKKYRGTQYTPKENQAIENFTQVTPTVHNAFNVGYNKADFKGNATTIIVKKILDQTGKYIYMALIKKRGSKDQPAPEPEEPPTPPASPPAGGGGAKPPIKEEEESGGDEIQIVKSVPFDGQSGDNILTNFLQSIFNKMA